MTISAIVTSGFGSWSNIGDLNDTGLGSEEPTGPVSRIHSGGSGIIPVLIVSTGGVGVWFGKGHSFKIVTSGEMGITQPIPMMASVYTILTS